MDAPDDAGRAAGQVAEQSAAARYTNLQRVVPLLQLLGLPVYWWIGSHLIGLGTAGAALFALVAPVAVHGAVLGIGFIVSYHNQHEIPGQLHGPRLDWLIAWVTELGVSLREFYWLMPFREGFKSPAPTPPLQPLPILFIHGYGCNRGLWLPAAHWFAERGYTISAINLTPVTGPIDVYGAGIAAGIRALRQRTGAARVALVCHSMGGLAARVYLRDCQKAGVDPAVAALITLGTPHRGTHTAWLGLGANARQMRFGSDWIGQLMVGEPLPPRLVTTIGSLQDNIVSRQATQRLDGARAILVRRQGHMSLASSPRVFRVIDRLLRRASIPR